MPSSRPERVGGQIRSEITEMLSREIKDPGIGFVTVTNVKVSADLQHARVYYTTLGEEGARRDSARALDRAAPYIRRQLAHRLRLRRTPELQFFFDDSIERHDRLERILQEIQQERESRPPTIESDAEAGSATSVDAADSRHDERKDNS
jgi:ribosome-binding factor A